MKNLIISIYGGVMVQEREIWFSSMCPSKRKSSGLYPVYGKVPTNRPWEVFSIFQKYGPCDMVKKGT